MTEEIKKVFRDAGIPDERIKDAELLEHVRRALLVKVRGDFRRNKPDPRDVACSLAGALTDGYVPKECETTRITLNRATGLFQRVVSKETRQTRRRDERAKCKARKAGVKNVGTQ